MPRLFIFYPSSKTKPTYARLLLELAFILFYLFTIGIVSDGANLSATWRTRHLSACNIMYSCVCPVHVRACSIGMCGTMCAFVMDVQTCVHACTGRMCSCINLLKSALRSNSAGSVFPLASRRFTENACMLYRNKNAPYLIAVWHKIIFSTKKS